MEGQDDDVASIYSEDKLSVHTDYFCTICSPSRIPQIPRPPPPPPLPRPGPRQNERMNKAAKLRHAWWNLSYSFLGMFTMNEAPITAIIQINVFKTFISKLDKSWFLMIFSLQGITSLTYSPIMAMIQLKFLGQSSPFDTHSPLFIMAMSSYLGILVGFVVLIMCVIRDDADSVTRESCKYRIICGFVLSAILLVPASLILIVITPAHRISEMTIIAAIIVPMIPFFVFVRYDD